MNHRCITVDLRTAATVAARTDVGAATTAAVGMAGIEDTDIPLLPLRHSGIDVMKALHAFVILALVCGLSATAQKKGPASRDEGSLPALVLDGLKFRSIGPALTSGRIADIAVDLHDRSRYFVAVASGGVWKTTNAGTTWTPVFDKQSSYSIGCVAIDPRNPSVIWVGTGENNSQRSVSYGDGVYRSEDGGSSWENMGLKSSEHIGKILIDPRDSRVVYVAAQGPLWNPGGDRGLYKTTDGGKTWEAVLTISKNTGVTDVVMDPRNPDLLYAAAYQRRRHVWTLINGGPESAIYRSEDGGADWKKLTSGLPSEDMGRIGLTIPPTAPDIVYATIEAALGKGGLYRSTDRGASWEKRGDYVSASAQYYSEIFADPKDPDRIYSMDVYLKVSTDGGKTFKNLGEKSKHVDNHAMWIDPENTNYYLVGCDGGLYESFDRGATWNFKVNLPVTQFYRVNVDNAMPFYNVYGGTQDNFSLVGPSRNMSATGIENAHWVVTATGDGFVTQIDPEDPNIVYAESQYGGLVRYDKKSGEIMGIKPQEEKGEAPLRWNWDSPLLISPHSHTRLYFAANKLFRSDDRGNTWKQVSGDLTRQIDRNKLPVMEKFWSIDAVAKNASTSFYGNITALAESPLKEGVLFVGTDDGLIQISDNGGTAWRRVESFPGVPPQTYVSRLEASRHNVKTVFAAFENHKNGDFAPYLLRSDDGGISWTSISGNLPDKGAVYALVEDHEDPSLLFAGTEFGVYVTTDGGKDWTRLTGGLPTIAVRDIAIQRRENDLVLGTFGRGFYILDDYSPLRHLDKQMLGKPAAILPVKDALMYIESRPYGLRGKAFLGESFFAAKNPPVGATITYYMKDSLKTKKQMRQAREKELFKKGEPIPYPTAAELHAEEVEETPSLIFIIADEEGNVVRRLSEPADKGVHRVVWDLRYAAITPTKLTVPAEEDPFSEGDMGPLAMPGVYAVTMAKRVNGEETLLAGPVEFTAKVLGSVSLPAVDRKALVAFQEKVADLQRAVQGASRAAGEARTRIDHLKKAVLATPAAPASVSAGLDSIERGIREIQRVLNGDRALRSKNEPDVPSITERVNGIVEDQWQSTGAPTTTQQRSYEIAADEFASRLEALRKLIETDLHAVEETLERAGAPWTPGRVPLWMKR
ncbi:MAG: glycosyl hydrolase [Bacteroidota bacterium]